MAQPDAAVPAEADDTLLRIELPSPKVPIIVHWPLAEIDRSVPWLIALMR